MYKSWFLPTFLVGFSLTAQAQILVDSTQVGQWGEVVVKGARTVPTRGGFTLYPAPLQREHAANALDLLTQLRLPGVRIDPLEKSISSTMGTGSVVVLLNGVETTHRDAATFCRASCNRSGGQSRFSQHALRESFVASL